MTFTPPQPNPPPVPSNVPASRSFLDNLFGSTVAAGSAFTAKTPGNFVGGGVNSTVTKAGTVTAPQSGQIGNFWKWAAAFAVYSIVLVSLGESEKYGEVATAVAWLVFVGAGMYWYNDVDTSLAKIIGMPQDQAK